MKAVRPALVQIRSRFTLKYSLPQVRLHSEALRKKVLDLTRATKDPAPDALTTALIKELRSNPLDYLKKHGNSAKMEDEVFHMVGTGFVVRPDGYIIAGSQVIVPERGTLRRVLAGIVERYELPIAMTALTEDFPELASVRFQSTGPHLWNEADAVAEAVREAYTQYLKQHARVVSRSRKVTVLLGGPAKTSPIDIAPAEVIDPGQPFPGNVAALLKVRMRNLKALPVKVDPSLDVGDRVLMVGFRRPAEAGWAYNESWLQTETADGSVIKRDKSPMGFALFRTDANTVDGLAGAPVFDQGNKVIGLAAPVSSGDKHAVFVVPAQLIGSVLEKHGIR